MITAGASGIGAAIAGAFINSGAKVAVCDIDSKAIDNFKQSYPSALTIEADVSDPDMVSRVAARTLVELGGLDVLVNNAGIAGPTARVEDVSLEEWQHVLAVNLTAPFLFLRALASHFKSQQSGCIINISSTSTRHAIPNRVAYVASKFGLEGLSASLARELGPFGVRCNVISPGFVDNERGRKIVARLAETRGESAAAIEAEVLNFISLRRKVGMPEIGGVCLFLASEQASAITGQIIPVDGNVEWEA